MPPLEVAAGLVFHKGKLLITQRRPGDHLAGLWEFPGGKREAGETFEECLRRELDEELGIDVAVDSLIESLDHQYPDRFVRLQFYCCRWRSGEPTPRGCHALAWVTRDELRRYSFPAADSKLLAKLETSPELWAESPFES